MENPIQHSDLIKMELANRLFFRLYQCANMLHKTGTRAVEAQGLTTQQWAVMGALSRPEAAQGMGMGDLARYLLMSCALAQKFAPGTPFFHRLIIGYDVTDELFGITIARPGYLNPFYTYGAIALAAPAWAMGTALGIIAGNLLPVRVVSALSVALYGMFLAIIIPPARKNRVVAVLVMLSFALSFACGCLPGIASLSDGTRTILLTVLISCGAAVLFPVTPEAPETTGTEEVQA